AENGHIVGLVKIFHRNEEVVANDKVVGIVALVNLQAYRRSCNAVRLHFVDTPSDAVSARRRAGSYTTRAVHLANSVSVLFIRSVIIAVVDESNPSRQVLSLRIAAKVLVIHVIRQSNQISGLGQAVSSIDGSTLIYHALIAFAAGVNRNIRRG